MHATRPDELDERTARAAAAIERSLAAVRRRQRVQAATLVLGFSLAWIGAVWLTAAALRIASAPALALTAFVGVASIVAGEVVWPWLRDRGTLRTAGLLDRHLGGDPVVVAMELASGVRAGRWANPWSRDRISGHLQQVARAVKGVKPAQVLAWPRRAPLAVLGPAIALVVLVTLPWARPRLEPVAAPARSEVDGLASAPGAALQDVEVRLQPPAYTGLEVEILPSGSGAFSALPGTAVTVRAHCGVPLQEIGFRVGGGPWQAGEVRGRDGLGLSFVLGRESRYQVRATTVEGEIVESGPLRIVVLSDQAPEVTEASWPTDDVELRPGERLPLVLGARDDHGLGAVDVVLSRGGEEVDRERVAALEGPSVADLSVAWSPGADDPGGRHLLHVEVFDNDTVSGPKATRTTAVTVWVLTPRELQRRALAARAGLLDAVLLALGEHLLWQHAEQEGGPVDDGHATRASQQMAAVLAMAAEVRALGDPDADPAALATVGAVVDDVARSWDRVQRQIRRRTIDPRRARGEELRDALDGHVLNLERAALALDRLVTEARWDAALAASRDASAAMERLRQAIASGDMDAIGRAERDLERAMAEYHRQMAALQDTPSLDLANTPAAARTADLMQRVQALLAEGRHAEAMELLSQGASQMASLEQYATGGGNQAELLAQLDALIEQVEGLTEEQGRTNRSMADLATDNPAAGAPAGLDALRQQVATLRRDVAALRDESMHERLAEATATRTGRDDRYLQEADEGLSTGDLDRAIEGIARGDSELLDLVQIAELYADVESTGMDEARFGAWHEALMDAESEHLALLERILGIERQWRQARAEAAEPGREVAAGQRQLAQQVEQLREELGGTAHPMVGGDLQRGMLDGAGGMMEAAAAELERGRPDRALGDGEEAEGRLRQLRDQLDEMRSSAGQAGGMAMAAAGSWSYFHQGADTVEIPPPERYRDLEALRAAALEAVTEDAPPEYRPHNDAYYEELVR